MTEINLIIGRQYWVKGQLLTLVNRRGDSCDFASKDYAPAHVSHSGSMLRSLAGQDRFHLIQQGQLIATEGDPIVVHPTRDIRVLFRYAIDQAQATELVWSRNAYGTGETGAYVVRRVFSGGERLSRGVIGEGRFTAKMLTALSQPICSRMGLPPTDLGEFMNPVNLSPEGHLERTILLTVVEEKPNDTSLSQAPVKQPRRRAPKGGAVDGGADQYSPEASGPQE